MPRLNVYEGCNAVYIEHVPSGEVRCAGTGDDDFCAYLAQLQDEAATNDTELLEAYFPDLVEKGESK